MQARPEDEKPEEGLDYYIEDGRWVFTAFFLLKRGFCCQNRCRHCPYGSENGKSDPVSGEMGEQK